MKLRRVVGWTLAILVMVIGIGVAVGYVYLRSNAFRQFAIRKIVDQANRGNWRTHADSAALTSSFRP